MACDDVREFLADLGLNEPARRRAAEALAHVEGCGECRAALRDYDAIAATLRAFGELPPEEENRLPSGGASDPWAAFEKRITAPPRLKPLASGDRAARPVFGFLRVSGAVAAGVLLAVVGFFAGKTGFGTPAPRQGQTALAALSGPTPAEVAGGVRVFNEINGDFEGRTRWVLMTRGDVEVSLNESARPPGARSEPSGGRLLLVRLRLLRGADVVSDANLVIVAGQTADLAVPTTAGPSLRYRVVTSASAPGRVELRAEMRAAKDEESPEAALATDLQLRPDRTTPAGQLVTPGGAYDLAVSFGTSL